MTREGIGTGARRPWPCEKRWRSSLRPQAVKKVGGEFTCPVDGMRMKVTEQTPTAEYQGKTYYCCNKADKQACLQDPEPYAKGQSAE